MAEMPDATVETLLLGYGLFDCGHTGRRRALLRALGSRHVDTLVLSHATGTTCRTPISSRKSRLNRPPA